MHLFTTKALTTIVHSTLLALGLLVSGMTSAEQKQIFGDYEVHYSAFNSSFLEPDVAKSYGIQRSRYRGVINISVLEKQADGSLKAVRAFVKGNVKNLIQQTNAMNFRAIQETGAVYHISEFKIASEDTFTFTIDIQPNPNKPAFTLSFRQAVYPN